MLNVEYFRLPRFFLHATRGMATGSSATRNDSDRHENLPLSRPVFPVTTRPLPSPFLRRARRDDGLSQSAAQFRPRAIHARTGSRQRPGVAREIRFAPQN